MSKFNAAAPRAGLRRGARPFLRERGGFHPGATGQILNSVTLLTAPCDAKEAAIQLRAPKMRFGPPVFEVRPSLRGARRGGCMAGTKGTPMPHTREPRWTRFAFLLATVLLLAAAADPALGQISLPSRQPVAKDFGRVTAEEPLYGDGELSVESATVCPVDKCLTLEAPGDHVFWDGEYIDSALVVDPADCEEEGSPCVEYQLTVPAGGGKLRVGFDAVLQGFRSFPDPVGPPPGFRFRIQVKDPEGILKEESCLYDPECGEASTNAGYSTEVFVPSPAAGDWTVLVIPTDVTDLAFRMRAKLEPQTAEPPVRVLLPNLRLIPPYEPTLIAPAYPFGPAGPPGVSCMPEEMAAPPAGEGATRCLRFSAGVHNNGEGWIGIHFFLNPLPEFCPDPRPG